ncbi:hypothetical protein L5515_005183 [Caenorhabditis briggsae]|uniref:Uncharacterized protein n=1 Tax=Caenorhabditis briggsae TaxID=6238 RepID=A0AAE9ENI1_CAEBR|nr:hypothetical protein L5515_005183 [Caenorhabditis briggsae]
MQIRARRLHRRRHNQPGRPSLPIRTNVWP